MSVAQRNLSRDSAKVSKKSTENQSFLHGFSLNFCNTTYRWHRAINPSIMFHRVRRNDDSRPWHQSYPHEDVSNCRILLPTPNKHEDESKPSEKYQQGREEEMEGRGQNIFVKKWWNHKDQNGWNCLKIVSKAMLSGVLKMNRITTFSSNFH